MASAASAMAAGVQVASEVTGALEDLAVLARDQDSYNGIDNCICPWSSPWI